MFLTLGAPARQATQESSPLLQLPTDLYIPVASTHAPNTTPLHRAIVSFLRGARPRLILWVPPRHRLLPVGRLVPGGPASVTFRSFLVPFPCTACQSCSRGVLPLPKVRPPYATTLSICCPSTSVSSSVSIHRRHVSQGITPFLSESCATVFTSE